MEDIKWYFKNHKYPLMGWTPDCKYPVIYAERGRAQFRYILPKNNSYELLNFMNRFILNQNDLAASLGIDYEDEEFGKNQVRKVETFQDDKNCGLNLAISYPASYSLNDMTNALKKLCGEHMALTLESNLDPVFFDKNSYLSQTLESV